MATTRRHLRALPDPYVDARREDRVIYRLRVELAEIEPTIWREFEVASDVHLDELHDVVQAVMGWTDSHLHRFGVGDDWYRPDTQEFITEFDMDEGEEGVLESDVRLDELLQEPGDRLLYLYDFGDSWRHTITLEGERLPDAVEGAARCLDGARACPPEDCGGIGGYDELVTDVEAAVRGDAMDDWQVERLHWLAGDRAAADVKAGFESFEVDEVNAFLDRRSRWGRLSGELGDLVRRMPGAQYSPAAIDLIDRIPADPPGDIDVDLAREATEPFAWMIRRIGAGGLRLTAAGYLRPEDVVALAQKLNLADEWIGKLNREDLTPPITDFRELMRALGLARQVKGRLLTTKIARAMVDDPVRLWGHIAARLPLGDGAERDVGLIGLLLTAAGVGEGDPSAGTLYAELMDALGWLHPDGLPLMASDSTWPRSRTRTVIYRAEGFERLKWGRAGPPTDGGMLLARAALA